MSILKGKITAPVGFFEMSNLLRVSQNIQEICLASAINPFARYKPENINGFEIITEAQRKANKYGLTPFQLSSYSQAVNYCNGSMNGWGYQKPTRYWRITDFLSEDGKNGYNHNAPSIVTDFRIFGSEEATFTQSDSIGFVMSYFPSQWQEDAVTLDILNDIGDCYVGVYARNTANNTYRRLTTSTTIGSSGDLTNGSLIFPANSFTAGNWVAYPFLSSVRYATVSEADAFNARYFSVPFASPVPFRVQTVANAFTVAGLVTKNGKGGLKGTITIRNNSGSSATFTSNRWVARFVTNRLTDPFEPGESQGTIPSFTVANGSSYTFTFTDATASGIVDGRMYNLWITLSGTRYTGQWSLPIWDSDGPSLVV